MITVRRSDDRGHASYGWLDTRYTFSFADYFDPDHRGFGYLRVLNEDWIEAGKGFDEHPHRDMEIITYIIEGALSHSDSMGNGSTIRRGDVQHMTAGSGLTHSERNPSATEATHLLQIWLLPDENGLPPRWEEKHFPVESKADQFCLIASKDGRDSSLQMNQSSDLYSAIYAEGASVDYDLDSDRLGWLHLISGKLELNGIELNTGDGAAIEEENGLKIKVIETSEFLFFDMK